MRYGPPIPTFIAPIQALAVEKLPEGDWLYEVKLDGYRALAFKDGQVIRLISRNNKPLNYRQILEAVKLLPAKQLILDGEIVAPGRRRKLVANRSQSISKKRSSEPWNQARGLNFGSGSKTILGLPRTARYDTRVLSDSWRPSWRHGWPGGLGGSTGVQIILRLFISRLFWGITASIIAICSLLTFWERYQREFYLHSIEYNREKVKEAEAWHQLQQQHDSAFVTLKAAT